MIHFLKYKFICLAASVAMVAAGIGGYIYHGGFRYSVDFTGGTQGRFSMSQPVGSEKLKEILTLGGWHDPVIREFDNNDVAIRIAAFANDSQGLVQKMCEVMRAQLPDVKIEILEANVVGSGVGESLRSSAFLMGFFVLLAMLLYIAFRFWSWSYGVSVVAALVHDGFFLLTVLVLLQKEISPHVVVAILATLGYSMNDTIVILSQVRKNLAKMKDHSTEYIIDLSLNQTLRRTLLTSFGTSLMVGSAYFFGGETLHGLTFTLLVGIAIGTYSSVYVASPMMLLLKR